MLCEPELARTVAYVRNLIFRREYMGRESYVFSRARELAKLPFPPSVNSRKYSSEKRKKEKDLADFVGCTARVARPIERESYNRSYVSISS